MIRQVIFWNVDARCPANNALGAVHAQMEHYLHYIVEYQYFCTIIESFLLAQLQYTSCICSEWRCRNECATNWYIINISKLTWLKGCKANGWVFQTFWTMKLKYGIVLSSAIRLGRWRTNCVHEILLTNCNANLLRQVKFWDIDRKSVV